MDKRDRSARARSARALSGTWSVSRHLRLEQSEQDMRRGEAGER